MSKEFQPSVASAKIALGNNLKVEQRSHPAGAQGAAVSLQEVAKKIREGRLDPRVRAWAGEILVDAGKPTDPIVQSQAILDAFRKKTMYVPDPVGAEFMVAAKNTLCLDDQGLCIKIFDCDDGVIAIGSALMSIGIPIKVIGQSFNDSPVPTHVLLAIETSSGYKKIDPSSSVYKVGEAYPGKKETWVDPMSTGPISINGSGDFVGIGHTPNYDGTITVGIGIADLGAPTRQEVFDLVTAQFQAALTVLENSVNSLGSSLHSIEQSRSLVDPNKPFDPEPFNIAGLNDFPTNGIWTQNMATIATRIWSVGNTLVLAGHEALDGSRQLLVDKITNEVYVEAKDQDPWRLHTVIETITDKIIGFFTAAGTLISGFDSKTATILTKDQIDNQIRSGQIQGLPIGIGVIPALPLIPVVIIVSGIIVTAAIAGLTIYYSIAKQADAASIAAKEATNKLAIECIASGKCPPEVLKQLGINRVAETEAEIRKNTTDPLANTASSISSIVTWVVIGGAVAAGIYIAAPTLKKLLEESTSTKMRRLT